MYWMNFIFRKIIRIIYDKFIHATMGANTVARYLNRQGYVKKKRQNGTLDAFTAHFVKRVLDNPILEASVDLTAYEKEELSVKAQIKQLTVAK